LRAALVAGRVDGSVYTGECACLVGTLAQTHAGHELASVAEAGLALQPDSTRPAEQWFMPIRKGDAPSDAEDRSEGVYRATTALRWVDEWTASRTAIATALTRSAA